MATRFSEIWKRGLKSYTGYLNICQAKIILMLLIWLKKNPAYQLESDLMNILYPILYL